MSKWVWVGIGALALTVAVGAYRNQGQKAEREAAKRTAANASAGPQAVAAPPVTPQPTPSKPVPGEPPEDVLVAFMREEYEEINRAGGLPVTVTASGKSTVLKPKLYSARKIDCKPMPREPEGSYECSLDMMVTLREGDTKPGKHAERQHLHWDGQRGEWVRGLAASKRKKG